MRLRIINAQLTCKQQLIYFSFKNIIYYRLKITRDKILEVIIWVWVNPIFNSPFQKYSWILQQTIAMSNPLDNLQSDSWQS